MRGSLLFVHGTGVRAEGFASTLQIVQKGCASVGLPVTTVGCYWGEAEGARLAKDGTSIPHYASTGGTEPTPAEEALALWAVLYLDPWYELRLLRHRRVVDAVPIGQEPPSITLRRSIDSFAPSQRLREEFATAGIIGFVDNALDALRGAHELDEAIRTAPPDPLEHRAAIARAFVAATLAASYDAGVPAVSGDTRDSLVAGVGAELRAEGLGLGSVLRRPLTGLARKWVTEKIAGDRGALSDAAAPMAGDVLRFLARGDGVREFVQRAIRDLAPGPVYLLGHSLGGVICADILIRQEIPEVSALITVGSQTPFLYEIGALPSLSPPDALPQHMPKWLNIYDKRDFLSYVGGTVFDGAVDDVGVDNGQPFPQSHSAYWSNRETWAAISEILT